VEDDILLISLSETPEVGMGDILLRGLEDDVVADLRRLAEEHGRSLSAEIREILRRETAMSKSEWLEGSQRFLDELAGTPQTSAAQVVRESRDER
jgi:plasmid stability protein